MSGTLFIVSVPTGDKEKSLRDRTNKSTAKLFNEVKPSGRIVEVGFLTNNFLVFGFC